MAAAVLICIGDPFWLGMPLSVAAVTAAWRALRRSGQTSVVAHFGLTLGLFDILLWILLVLFIQYVMKMDTSFIFDFSQSTGQ